MHETDTSEPHAKSPAEQAARAGWIAPLLAVAVNMFLGSTSEERTVILSIGLLAGVMVLIGFVCALWAIASAVAKGPRRLLIPGAIGLILNGSLIYLTIYTFQYVAQHARQQENDNTLSSD